MSIESQLHPGVTPPAVDDALDVRAATREALAAPHGFPPFVQALVPGDLVAIALGEGVRCAADVVRGIVDVLEQAGSRRDSIIVVTGDQVDAERLLPQLSDLVDEGCRFVGHDPTNDQSLCFLAAVDDKPLLVNRELFDADVVVPVGCARLADARDYRGPYDTIFPRFADIETIRQYAQGDALDSPTAIATRRRQTDQAGTQLAAPLVLQVVPGHGATVAAVVAGAPDAVEKVIADQCQSLWLQQVEQRANLVVATLAGGPEEQTWHNVARALFAASRVADEDSSAVAICTELNEPPGEALQELMSAGGDLERAGQLGDHQSPDAAASWELYKALCRGPVFFMSKLDDETVEDLGMAPIASADELARLVKRSGSCVTLDEAQHNVPVLVENK
ncbi:MAG: lactate racemase domain-containing protein [Aeoliella sp.]